MKKINKALLITSMAVVTIGSIEFFNNNVIQKIAETNKTSIQAYNHNAQNILDNVFEQNEMTILPFIFENTNKNITKEKVISDFEQKGLTVTSITSKNSNGQTVTVKNNNGQEIVATGTEVRVSQNNTIYTVLVYGDVNRSGIIDLIDAQKIMLNAQNPERYPLNTIEFLAANLSNDDNNINLIDAQRLVMLKLGATTKLVRNEPSSLKENDNIPPVIKIDDKIVTETQRITINVGDTYTEPRVTATDNIDGNITVTKSGDTVNTSRAGTYTVVYTATDAKGNTATATIIVTVENRNSGGGSGGSGTSSPTLTDIEIAENVTLYTEAAKGVIKDGLTYTVLPIKFLYGTQELRSDLIAGQISKLKVNLPEVTLLNETKKTGVIKSEYFDQDGNGIIDGIGFAIANKEVNIDSIEKINLKVGSKSHDIRVNIEYANNNNISNLTFIDSSVEAGKNKGYAGIINSIYVVKKYTGAEEGIFTLGRIVSRNGERPVKKEEIQEFNDETGNLSLYYEYDTNGVLFVKGKLRDATPKDETSKDPKTYKGEIKSNITGMIFAKEVYIKAIDVQGELNITFTKTIATEGNNILINKESNERLLMKAVDDNSKEIDILGKYIKISGNSDVVIQKQTSNKFSASDNDVVKFLKLTTTYDGTKTETITVKLFEGCPGLETEGTFTVNIGN